MPLGNFHIHQTFFHQAALEGDLYIVFTMDKKKFFHLLQILAGQPLAEVLVVAVGAHAPDRPDLGVHLVLDAEDPHLFLAGHQTASQRIGLAITGHEDAVAAVLDIVADVMFHTPGFRHATG